MIHNQPIQSNIDYLRKVTSDILDVFTRTVETHDPFTKGHQYRVAQLATTIGKELALADESIEALYIAGSIHDIGKITVPMEILTKTTPLTADEYKTIQTHPQTACYILKEAKFPGPIDKIIYQHHERNNGSGYPNGITSKQILPEAKILAVADVVEAMTNPRSYRPAKSIEEAMDFLSHNISDIFDPNAVVACQDLFIREKFKFD